MQNRPQPEVNRYGHVQDPSTGLFVPETYHRNPSSAIIAHADRSLSKRGLSQGLELARDEDTLAVRFPRKGSGFDDLIAQAIVDGRVANAGVSPVIAPQISGMVSRQMNQAMTATIDVTGKQTPVKKARDAIAMFNDAPLGVNDALETIIYRLCTYNRGAPIATVPITFEFDTWEEYGMIAHPILTRNQKEENASRFWLEVDWQKFGTPVPFLPHPFALEATGNDQYPYWYRATKEDGKNVWVLLHSSQIIPLLPGKSAQAGVGSSPVWKCLGYLAEQILITEERSEKMLYGLTDGIVLLGGVNDIDPDKIKEKIEEGRIENLERGLKVAKGVTIIASPTDKVSAAQITLRQPPGIEFKDWREWCEDVIAFNFGEPLSALVIRGGVGYGAQSDTASDNAAESGVGAHLGRVGGVLGAIYPRVVITVTRANDRVARANINTFTRFSSGAGNMIDKGVLTPGEVRTIIDRDILIIPDAEAVTTSANTEDNDDDLSEQDSNEQRERSSQEDDGETEEMSVVQNLHDYGNPRLPLEIHYRDDDVVIEDTDIDRAFDRAHRRVGEQVFEMLNATREDV